MKPGDLIEWVYKNGKVVDKDEELWSSPEDRWVPIGGTKYHLVVSVDENKYSWLNDDGLFHAYVEDVKHLGLYAEGKEVVPRVCG